MFIGQRPGMNDFRFWDEDDYENEIFSTSVILAGKRDSRRHSTTRFKRECRCGGNKLSNVRSSIILPYRERV